MTEPDESQPFWEQGTEQDVDSPLFVRPLESLGTRFRPWISSVDHKQIGIMYMLTACGFLLLGGFEAMLIRIQLWKPNNHFLTPNAYNQIFTMHGTTMIFLVVMPLLVGLANYLVPLMIGARDMAYPRLNALGYWFFLLGGLLLYFSFAAGGAPDAGWFSYAPLSEHAYSTSYGLDYWVLGLLVSGIGTVSAGLNFIVTILNLRPPGMSLFRLPLFVWMMLVTSFLIIFAFPALNSALVMLEMDRVLNAHFFVNEGSPILWQHYFWAFGHPEVYIMALPAFGIISEVIPVFSRKPIFGYGFVFGSTLAIGLLSYGVWAHHMFAVGLGIVSLYGFSVTSLLIAVPTGVKVFNWIFTIWGGRIRYTTAMLFAIGFLLQFTIGGLSGVMFAMVPLDWQATDSYLVVAHFHYVLLGGTLFGLFSGTYYWFPKMTGRLLNEKLGKMNFWTMVLGFNLTFMVQHFLGLMGMPRRVYTYPDLPGWTAFNQVSTVGAFVMLGSFLLFGYNVFWSVRNGEIAGPNPWNAWTLEWLTSSPPPHDNFALVPPIGGRRPLWDLAHPDEVDGGNDRRVGHPCGPVLDTNKLMLLLFCASEAVFFLFLIIAYLFFHSFKGQTGPSAASSLDPFKTGLFTCLLFASSGTLMVAERVHRQGKTTAFRIWMGITILLGASFLGGQGMEYHHLLESGVTVGRNLFGSTFFTLTGLHGFHVMIGLVILSIFTGLGQKASPSALAAAGIYWHFVDLVWLAVFTTIYLGVYV
jgi:cytochrome c oxidase subunit I